MLNNMNKALITFSSVLHKSPNYADGYLMLYDRPKNGLGWTCTISEVFLHIVITH